MSWAKFVHILCRTHVKMNHWSQCIKQFKFKVVCKHTSQITEIFCTNFIFGFWWLLSKSVNKNLWYFPLLPIADEMGVRFERGLWFMSRNFHNATANIQHSITVLVTCTGWLFYTLESFPTFEILDIKLDNDFSQKVHLYTTHCHQMRRNL